MQSCRELNEFMPILTATNGLAYCVLKGQLSCHKGAAVCQDEFMPILTATNGLAYCVLKGQLSCHKGAAVCQDTGALGGQGYRGLGGQG